MRSEKYKTTNKQWKLLFRSAIEMDWKNKISSFSTVFPSETALPVSALVKEGKDDLYQCLQPLIWFGKFIGLLPISHVFSKDLTKVVVRKWAGILYSALVICILSGTTLVSAGTLFFNSGKDASDFASKAGPMICYSIGLYLYIYFLRSSQRLLNLFFNWRTLVLNFEREDTKLRRHVFFISFVILTSAILENAVSHLELFPFNGDEKFDSEHRNNPLRYYFSKVDRGQYETLFPYNAVIPTFVFLANKWAVYAWNFMDVLIACLCRAMYFKFQTIHYMGEKCLILSYDKFENRDKWTQIVEDYYALRPSLDLLNELVSPLLLVSYAANVYFICIQLYYGLSPMSKLNTISTLYAIWSFSHLIFRMMSVSLMGAKVNDQVNQICKLLGKCPDICFNKSMERLERRLLIDRVGVEGVGCFVITRPFILSLASVIFTFEIVLLQTAASTNVLMN